MMLKHNPAKVLHFINQGFNLTGIIHIGANDGEEVPSYKEIGIKHIVCVEPIPSKCKEITDRHFDVITFNCAAGDTDGDVELNLVGDECLKGSSILEAPTDGIPKEHGWAPQTGEKITVPIHRMDTLFKRIPTILQDKFNCIVIDVQGFELQVLKGFGSLITKFPYWSIECSRVPVYKGEAAGQEIVDYMADHGFIQDSPMEDHNDVFFIDKKIKPVSDMVYRGGLE